MSIPAAHQNILPAEIHEQLAAKKAGFSRVTHAANNATARLPIARIELAKAEQAHVNDRNVALVEGQPDPKPSKALLALRTEVEQLASEGPRLEKLREQTDLGLIGARGEACLAFLQSQEERLQADAEKAADDLAAAAVRLARATSPNAAKHLVGKLNEFIGVSRLQAEADELRQRLMDETGARGDRVGTRTIDHLLVGLLTRIETGVLSAGK